MHDVVRELTLPDKLISRPGLSQQNRHDYAAELADRMDAAYEFTRNRQSEVRQEDPEQPLLFSSGDLIWLKAKRHRKGGTPKLQAKWQGPYKILEAYDNHTYLLDLYGRKTVEN